jgi:hypothetical protein
MCQQEHLGLALYLSKGIAIWQESPNNAHILADVAKVHAAIKSAAGILKNLGDEG